MVGQLNQLKPSLAFLHGHFLLIIKQQIHCSAHSTMSEMRYDLYVIKCAGFFLSAWQKTDYSVSIWTDQLKFCIIAMFLCCCRENKASDYLSTATHTAIIQIQSTTLDLNAPRWSQIITSQLQRSLMNDTGHYTVDFSLWFSPQFIQWSAGRRTACWVCVWVCAVPAGLL